MINQPHVWCIHNIVIFATNCKTYIREYKNSNWLFDLTITYDDEVHDQSASCGERDTEIEHGGPRTAEGVSHDSCIGRGAKGPPGVPEHELDRNIR